MTPRFLAIATIAASLAVPAFAAQDNSQNFDPKSMSSQQVKDVQQALKDKGELQGQADGVWGPQSAKALSSFQKEQNINGANGRLDDKTVSALGLNSSDFQSGENGSASTSAGGSAPSGNSSGNSSSSYGSGSNSPSTYNSGAGSSSGSSTASPNAMSPNGATPNK